jgi:expansin (peptidoglycan-binding protein)
MSGSLACTQPWRANNVEARLLTPNTSGMTACSMAGSAVPTLAAAVDEVNFRGAQACGACLRVQNAAGTASVVVPVVEKSGANGLLLTKAAMDQIMPNASLTTVSWSLVACDVQGQPVRYFIKDGSNAGYVGVQVRNARYPIATISTVGSNAVALALQTYNYWESTAAGAGPLTLRLTDINGQSFQDSGIKIQPQVETTGQGQFPVCR